MDEVEVCPAQDFDEAVLELNRSPAQALIINAPSMQHGPLEQIGDLPFGTPAVICWVPGEEEVAQRLGVVRYLVRPVAQEKLLAALEELGDDIKDILLG